MITFPRMWKVDPKDLLREGLRHEQGGADVEPFLAPCVRALAQGRVLVGRTSDILTPGVLRASRPLVAAYPDGRVTIYGEAIEGALGSLRLPGSAYDAALAFYALVGWQRAEMIARAHEGCPDCHGSGVVPRDSLGRGSLFVACDCGEIEDEDVAEPHEIRRAA